MAIGSLNFIQKPLSTPASAPTSAAKVDSTMAPKSPAVAKPVDSFEAAPLASAAKPSGLGDLSKDLNNNTAGGAGKLGGASGIDLDQVASKQDKINNVIDDALA
jgi:hypothetical protein